MQAIAAGYGQSDLTGMPNFFISYRRSDKDGQFLAHTLFRELRRHYGEYSVFLDVDSRSPGLSFPLKVDKALGVTDVVLVIIGPDWLRLLNERLGDSRDWVRYEVAESLKRRLLPVVPVCCAGVEIPRPNQLPEELKDLGWRDGVTFDLFQDFDVHLARLLRDVEHVLEMSRNEKEELRLARRKLIALVQWRGHQLELAAARNVAAKLAAETAAKEELRLARRKLIALLQWRGRHLELAAARTAAAKLAAETAANERAAAEERRASEAKAADLADHLAAVAKAATAMRATAQTAQAEKKTDPQPQKGRETPISKLGSQPSPVAPSRSTSGRGPSLYGASFVKPLHPPDQGSAKVGSALTYQPSPPASLPHAREEGTTRPENAATLVSPYHSDPLPVRTLRGSEAKSPGPKYYHQLAGRYKVSAVILSLLVSGPVIFVLAVGYSYSLLGLPFVQGNFILTLLYGALSGVVVGFALRRSKVGKAWVGVLGGLVAGLVAVHFSWAIWTFGHLRQFNSMGLIGLWGLVSSPIWQWNILRDINATGSWDVWGYRPTGIVLWLVWSVEAALIAGLSSFFSFMIVDIDIFCEACGTWCAPPSEFAKLRISSDLEDVRRRLAARDFAVLKVLGSPPSGAVQWLKIDLCRCKKCGATNILNAFVANVATNAKGRPTTTITSLVWRLLVTTAECDEIQRIGHVAARR